MHLWKARALDTKRLKRIKRATLRAKRRLRAGDGWRATIVTMVLLAILLPMVAVGTTWRVSTVEPPGAMAQAAANADAERQARVIGSIVFVTTKKICEEIRFNNIAEAILSVDDIDCEARFAPELRGEEAAKVRRQRVRGVLAGFGK